jgi:hypothetical protein
MQRELEPEVMDTPEEASEYDAMDHTEANTAFVDRLIALGARGRMLDIGTGPGHIPASSSSAVNTAEASPAAEINCTRGAGFVSASNSRISFARRESPPTSAINGRA